MKLISVASGKGGVGKTTTVCQLAYALAEKGNRVLIFDGDLGMANVDIMLGVRSEKTISDVLNGEQIFDCITKVSANIDLLAGGSGQQDLVATNAFQRREILQQIESLQFVYDYVLIDTAPGLHDYVLHLNSAADQCLLLITQDPSSFADAYALVKVMYQKYKTKSFQVVCNQIADVKGEVLFDKFSDVVEKFLNIRLSYLGSVEFDKDLKNWQQNSRLNLKQAAPSKETMKARPIYRQICSDLTERMQSKGSEDTTAKGLHAIFRPVTGHA